ncbi:hypothetical protein H3V53_29645 [Paraburkholderia bengalensis]|uniref:Uncharacterized protein n=1 Tax=Paraburkholderia bengalensis TaxID=2747562 RepID=A0ABU8J035_9BURK
MPEARGAGLSGKGELLSGDIGARPEIQRAARFPARLQPDVGSDGKPDGEPDGKPHSTLRRRMASKKSAGQ